MTGCTIHPAPGDKFFKAHKNHETPALSPDNLSKDSLKSLNSQHTNRERIMNTGKERDNIFVVEGKDLIELVEIICDFRHFGKKGNNQWREVLD